MAWTAANIPAQKGRTFIVTGANSGLGYVTALELARHGARVVLAVRSTEKGDDAAGRIRRAVPDASLEVRKVDLADLDSVRAFAEGIDALDVLVNNAGIMMPPRSLTKQGYELQLGSNHLGHFALTALLYPKLNRETGRVVTVTSDMHRVGKIHFDDLDGERRYSPTDAYAQSKLANVLFGLELHRRLTAKGSRVKSLLAHPGYSDTPLQGKDATGVTKRVLRLGSRLLAQTVEMGALGQLFAAVSPDLRGGELVGPDGFQALRGHPKVLAPSSTGRDPEVARRLWDISEQRTVRFEV